MKFPTRRLFGALLFISLLSSSHAQIHAGWRLGAGVADVYTDYNDYPTRPMISFEVEATVHFNLVKHWSIETGLCFNNKGYLLKNRPAPGLKVYKYPIYLQIPLRLMYADELFFSSLGPYWATTIGGKERSNYRAAIQTRNLSYGSRLDDDFMPTDAGISFQFGLCGRKLRYGVGWDWGIANVFPEEKRGYVIDFKSMKHTTIRLFLAETFSGK